MSVNSSSSNDSLLHPNISPFKVYILSSMHCYITRPSSLIYTGFFITNIFLLLPLCSLILYTYFQKCWIHRTNYPASTHSDIFTYHMATVDLFCVLGYIILCCGIYQKNVSIIFVGYCLWSFAWYGQTFFHLLTCVERYLAVVRPITYLSLRGERGIRIRNFSIGLAWFLCCGGMSLENLENVPQISYMFVMILSLIILSFCSLSVLCVLIRSGPGEQGRERVEQSKQRAFYTIVAILGALSLRFSWSLIWCVLNESAGSNKCVSQVSGVWFHLPSSLVIPLLFLHREETLASCKKKLKKGALNEST